MEQPVRRIVVVGGGFAGLNFLKPFRNCRDFHLTLIDKNNYHYFPPLLYQIGMAFIEPSNITYPYRRFFQEQTNIDFHLGNVVRVVPEENYVETETAIIRYDHLVLALGTETNYFDMEKVRANALALKTIDDAINLRNHLLLNLEKACRTKIPEERARLLTVVIAGGGPTGVEVAGMLAEMMHSIQPKEYPEITKDAFTIYLIQGGSVVLNSMSTTAQQEAQQILVKLGVKILLNVRVKDFDRGNVLLSNGETIRTNALLWTSGVTARVVNGIASDKIGPGMRIMVDQFNKIKGYENIYAIGDIALATHEPNFPNGHPQLAQVAIQQGKLLAKNLINGFRKKPPVPFAYRNKGTMAIISKFKAVADLPRLSFKGFFAWLLWLFVHLLPIAGFRNKVSLILDWAWAFMTNDPTLRLIIRPGVKEARIEKETNAPAVNHTQPKEVITKQTSS